ncbi:MAG: GntR family transcriptional regulator [Planctomycetota bacterium]
MVSETQKATGTAGANQRKYQHVSETIAHKIRSGELKAGDRLPSDDALCREYAVSSTTVGRALGRLRDMGFIERIQGTGTFVKRPDLSDQMRFMFIGSGLGRVDPRTTVFAELGAALDRRLWKDLKARVEPDHRRADDVVSHRDAAVAHAVADGVDGVFYLPMEGHENAAERNAAWVSRLREAGACVVLIDQDIVAAPRRSDLDLVGLDHYHAGWTVGSHARERGARRVMVLGPRSRPRPVVQRLDGLSDSLGDGVELRYVPSSVDEGELVESIREFKPDMAIGKDDRRAALAVRALFRMKLSIPDDVMVCGFGDSPIASELPVPVTSYAQPIDLIAENAIRLMRERFIHRDRPATQLLLAGRLMVRDSSTRG